MKKTLLLAVCAVFIFGLAACGGGENGVGNTDTGNPMVNKATCVTQSDGFLACSDNDIAKEPSEPSLDVLPSEQTIVEENDVLSPIGQDLVPPVNPEWEIINTINMHVNDFKSFEDGKLQIAVGFIPAEPWGYAAIGTFVDGVLSRYDVFENNPAELFAVWGSSPTDIYAVGGVTHEVENFTNLYHYNGSRWSEMDIPEIPEDSNLYAVWGTGRDNVYIGGGKSSAANPEENPIIFHYDGQTWRVELVEPPNDYQREFVLGLWGNENGDVWAAGGNGQTGPDAAAHVHHYSPLTDTWTLEFTSNRSSALKAIAPLHDGRLVFGDHNLGQGFFRDKNNNWTHFYLPGSAVNNFWESGDGNLYAAMREWGVSKYDGNEWRAMSLPADATDKTITGIGGTTRDEILAIGMGGTIYRHYPMTIELIQPTEKQEFNYVIPTIIAQCTSNKVPVECFCQAKYWDSDNPSHYFEISEENFYYDDGDQKTILAEINSNKNTKWEGNLTCHGGLSSSTKKLEFTNVYNPSWCSQTPQKNEMMQNSVQFSFNLTEWAFPAGEYKWMAEGSTCTARYFWRADEQWKSMEVVMESLPTQPYTYQSEAKDMPKNTYFSEFECRREGGIAFSEKIKFTVKRDPVDKPPPSDPEPVLRYLSPRQYDSTIDKSPIKVKNKIPFAIEYTNFGASQNDRCEVEYRNKNDINTPTVIQLTKSLNPETGLYIFKENSPRLNGYYYLHFNCTGEDVLLSPRSSAIIVDEKEGLEDPDKISAVVLPETQSKCITSELKNDGASTLSIKTIPITLIPIDNNFGTGWIKMEMDRLIGGEWPDPFYNSRHGNEFPIEWGVKRWVDPTKEYVSNSIGIIQFDVQKDRLSAMQCLASNSSEIVSAKLILNHNNITPGTSEHAGIFGLPKQYEPFDFPDTAYNDCKKHVPDLGVINHLSESGIWSGDLNPEELKSKLRKDFLISSICIDYGYNWWNIEQGEERVAKAYGGYTGENIPKLIINATPPDLSDIVCGIGGNQKAWTKLVVSVVNSARKTWNIRAVRWTKELLFKPPKNFSNRTEYYREINKYLLKFIEKNPEWILEHPEAVNYIKVELNKCATKWSGRYLPEW